MPGDTLRVTSGCQGTNPSSPYEFDTYDASSALVYSHFPLVLPFDYVITGNEASWYVIFDDNNACATTGSISVVTTVQNETANGNSISVYTDAYSAGIFIHSDAMLRDAEIELYNSSGELICSLAHCNGTEVLIDNDALAEGIYFLRVTQAQEVVCSKKILVGAR